MNPRVGLIVGDNSTDHCGVKDYAIHLGKALERLGMTGEVLAPADWGVTSFLRFAEEVRQQAFDILHVHYPSIGHRTSLCPHMVGWRRRTNGVVVTLHEYSALPLLQRASTHIFRWTADQLLFTTETELGKFGRTRVPKRVIPIGSSVPECSAAISRKPTILYFGQIRQHKGLEAFLELAALSVRRRNVFKFQIYGTVPPRRADYYEALRGRADPEIEWLIDLPFDEVGRRMARSLAAYLPFPDGASYRRSSLLAALTNGLPTITTVTDATPRDALGAVLPADGPADALAHIERLYSAPDEVLALSRAAKRLAERFSWTEIARQHDQVYRETLELVRDHSYRGAPSRSRVA